MIEDTETKERDPYTHLFRMVASERSELSSRENIALREDDDEEDHEGSPLTLSPSVRRRSPDLRASRSRR